MSLESATTENLSNSIPTNGNNSQLSTYFTGNEPILNTLTSHLGLDGLPKGRLLHHMFLRNCLLMRIPRCEPVRESILRETRKWKMTDDPLKRWQPVETMDVKSQPTPLVFPDAHEQIITYTDDDYNRLLSSNDWSKQETDRLIYFWNTFGGRFTTITDRYNYGLPDPNSFRPIEELKERLVDVANKLNEGRGIGKRLSYSKELDRNRRLQLEALQTRTSEQLMEEVMLTETMGAMLPDLPEQMKQRDVCLARLVQDEIAQPNSLTIMPSPTKPVKSDSTKRKKKPKKIPVVMVAEKPVEPVENQDNRPEKVSRSERKVTEIIPPAQKPVVTPGPHILLRSHTIKTVRSGLGRHVDRILMEHGLPIRPVYPSIESVNKYDTLRSLIVQWIDRQKELGLPSGTSLPGSTVTSMASSASTLNPLDTQSAKKRGRKLTASQNSSTSNLSTSDISLHVETAHPTKRGRRPKGSK